MNFREFLEGKVTSQEDFTKFSPCLNEHAIHMQYIGQKIDAPWWMMREWCRMEQGIYPPHTQATGWLESNNAMLCVHISRDDPKMVAYTPDRQSGLADRQVRTTLGKLLTKLYPGLPDHTVAKIQAEHLAELDGSFIETKGVQEISDNYRDFAFGSCMSYAVDRYSTQGHRPTDVYDHPHISMATLRNDEGQTTARAMLYCPTPEDRRFLRCYGDVAALRSRLLRSGYKPGTWEGAEFKIIPLNDGIGARSRMLVMPYLDANDNRGGEHSYVALVDGKLKAVSRNLAIKLRSLGEYRAKQATQTSGYIELRNTDMSEFERVCGLSGKTYSLLDEDVNQLPYWNGETVTQALASELVDANAVNMWISQYTEAYALPTVPTYLDGRHRLWLLNAENTNYLGLTKLDPKYYPEASDKYFRAGSSADLVNIADNGFAIKREDAVRVIRAGSSERTSVHKLEVLPTWVKLLPTRHCTTTLYAESAEDVVKTLSGKKVVYGVHDVTKLWDGTYDFDRNVAHFSVCGKAYSYNRKKGYAEAAVGTPWWKAALEKDFNNALRMTEGFGYAARRLLGRVIDRYEIVCGHSLYRLSGETPWSTVMADPRVNNNVEMQYVNYLYECAMAEANTLDYNTNQACVPSPATMPVEPVVQIPEAAPPWRQAAVVTEVQEVAPAPKIDNSPASSAWITEVMASPYTALDGLQPALTCQVVGQV